MQQLPNPHTSIGVQALCSSVQCDQGAKLTLSQEFPSQTNNYRTFSQSGHKARVLADPSTLPAQRHSPNIIAVFYTVRGKRNTQCLNVPYVTHQRRSNKGACLLTAAIIGPENGR